MSPLGLTLLLLCFTFQFKSAIADYGQTINGCDIDEWIFSFTQNCEPIPDLTFPTFNSHPGAQDKHDSTIVRIHIGQHEGAQMGGDIPGIGLFDELGQRIGDYNRLDKDAPEGGFKDVVIKHKPGSESVRPTYLMLNSFEDSICISAVAMTFPDGTKQFFTGDDLKMCPASSITTSPSRAFLGPGKSQPNCFWLTGRRNDQFGTVRLSLHLPDLVYSPARERAYTANPRLLCGLTPRLYPINQKGSGNPDPKVQDPIPIWNPPLEYDQQTHADKNPQRILNYKPNWNYDLSDRPLKPGRPMRKSRIMRSVNVTQEEPVLQSASDNTSHDYEVVEKPARTEAPTLVVSSSMLSAQEQCRTGTWDNTDYVSLSEKIYCDMQSRSMYRVCDSDVTRGCWDAQTRSLKGFADLGMNFSPFKSMWAATGPLYGFKYQNVSQVD